MKMEQIVIKNNGGSLPVLLSVQSCSKSHCWVMTGLVKNKIKIIFFATNPGAK
jgi:hypothetical protein